jgi:hypothetical protein
MKAVLEFTYPQDEDKLKHALKGEAYYLALIEIERTVANSQQFKGAEEFLDRLEDILSKGLEG